MSEFIKTERDYCGFLELCLESFFSVAPLNAIKSKEDLKTIQELKTNWAQLDQFHKSFLLTLETRCLVGGGSAGGQITESGAVSAVAIPTLFSEGGQPSLSSSDQTICLKPNAAQGLANVVIKLSPYFKLYSGYCRLYPLASKIFDDARESNSDFDACVKHFESLPATQNQSLGSILVKPVQRVCKYELFLRDLQRKAPANAIDLQTDIVMAYTATQNVVAKVNNTGKTSEQLANLATLQEQLRPIGKVDLLQSHRKLDLQGNAMAVRMLPDGPGGANVDGFNAMQGSSGGSSGSSSGSSSSSSSSSSRMRTSSTMSTTSVASGQSKSSSPASSSHAEYDDEELSQPLSTHGSEPIHIFLVSDVLLLCRYKLKKKSLMRSADKHR